ncbi:hypothetical protein, partial [Escherichia coli]
TTPAHAHAAGITGLLAGVAAGAARCTGVAGGGVALSPPIGGAAAGAGAGVGAGPAGLRWGHAGGARHPAEPGAGAA